MDSYGIIRGGANFTGISSVDIDRLLNDTAITTDFAKLKDVYRRLEQVTL